MISAADIKKISVIRAQNTPNAVKLQIGYTDFYVTSSNGVDEYHVQIHPTVGISLFDCTCPAGKNDRSCWHVAAVREYLMQPGTDHTALHADFNRIRRMKGIGPIRAAA